MPNYLKSVVEHENKHQKQWHEKQWVGIGLALTLTLSINEPFGMREGNIFTSFCPPMRRGGTPASGPRSFLGE